MSERFRVSVRRDGLTVPLFPYASSLEPETAPSSKLLCEKHSFRQLNIPEHEHAHFCLHVQLAGNPKLEWWWNGKAGSEEPEPGSLILLPRGTKDSLQWNGLSDRYVISLDADYVKNVADDVGSRETPEFFTRWRFRDTYLEGLLREIGRESSTGWSLGALYADVLGLRLALALLQTQTVQPIKIPSAKGGISASALRRTLEFITENLHEPLRLADIASIAGLSQFHFVRLFREATQTTPHQYFLDQRTTRAKHLLRTTVLSLEEIGCSVGFGSLAQFSHSFTSRTGLSPRVWRKVHATR